MIELRHRALLCWVAMIAVPVWLVSCDREMALGLVERALQSEDQAAQKQTVKDLRNVGVAMMSWLTDQVGAAAAGQTTNPPYDVRQVPLISPQELEDILVPNYLETLPEQDGWGHPYEFHLNTTDYTALNVMIIRSPGRDGAFSGDAYSIGSFAPEHFDEDVVWADGFFIRWPERR